MNINTLKHIKRNIYNSFISKNEKEDSYLLERHSDKSLVEQKKEIFEHKPSLIISEYLPSEFFIKWDISFATELIKKGLFLHIPRKINNIIGCDFEISKVLNKTIQNSLGYEIRNINKDYSNIQDLEFLFLDTNKNNINSQFLQYINHNTKVHFYGDMINDYLYFISCHNKFFYYQRKQPSLRQILNTVLERKEISNKNSDQDEFEFIRFSELYSESNRKIKFTKPNLSKQLNFLNLDHYISNLNYKNLINIKNILETSIDKNIFKEYIRDYLTITKSKQDRLLKSIIYRIIFLKDIDFDPNFCYLDLSYIHIFFQSLCPNIKSISEIIIDIKTNKNEASYFKLDKISQMKFFLSKSHKVSDFILPKNHSLDESTLKVINNIYDDAVQKKPVSLFNINCLGIYFNEKFIKLSDDDLLNLHNFLKLILFLHNQDNKILRKDIRDSLLNSNPKEASIVRQIQYEVFFKDYPFRSELELDELDSSTALSNLIQHFCNFSHEIDNFHFHFALSYQYFSSLGETNLAQSIIKFLKSQNADIIAFEYYLNLIKKIKKF